MRSRSQDLSWILDCILFPVPVSIPSAKAKGQAAKLNINAALVEDIINLDEVKSDMVAVVSSLKDDFTRSLSIRTSPGNPSFSKLFFISKLEPVRKESLRGRFHLKTEGNQDFDARVLILRLKQIQETGKQP